MKRRKLKGMVLSIMGALRGPGSTLALKLVHSGHFGRIDAVVADAAIKKFTSVANAQGAR
jgi:hypothetical protein